MWCWSAWGTGGEDLAVRLVDAGLYVIGVEAGLIGGEGAYWACLPSKLMIRAANLLAEARRVNGAAGITIGADSADHASRRPTRVKCPESSTRAGA